jgi:hypothetical protein
LSGNFQARSRLPDHRDRRPRLVTSGYARERAAELHRRPDAGDQTLDKWLDINAFGRAASGTWGNCGIGVARAPGFKNLNAALAKRVSVGGARNAEFRLEAFN